MLIDAAFSISHLLQSAFHFVTNHLVAFFFWKACNTLARAKRTYFAPGEAVVGHLRTRIMHVLGEEGTRIASNKTRRKWVDEHKSGTIGSVGRCPCGLGSGQWTPWPCETHAARVLHTVSHALPPPSTPRPCPPLPSVSLRAADFYSSFAPRCTRFAHMQRPLSGVLLAVMHIQGRVK